jgi:hypothetical protein
VRDDHKNKKASNTQQRYSKTILKRAIARRDYQTIRVQGERLFSIGGTRLMLSALWAVAGDDPKIVSLLDSAWDGVGGRWYR